MQRKICKVYICEYIFEIKSFISENLGKTEYIKEYLQRFMQHVPEQYPMILFIEKTGHDEIINYLLDSGYVIVKPSRIREQYEDAVLAGLEKKQIIVYDTENFDYEDDGIATIEKAFVDLYFSITRNGYPLSLQELARVYQNLLRLGNIDKKKMITVSTESHSAGSTRIEISKDNEKKYGGI